MGIHLAGYCGFVFVWNCGKKSTSNCSNWCNASGDSCLWIMFVVDARRLHALSQGDEQFAYSAQTPTPESWPLGAIADNSSDKAVLLSTGHRLFTAILIGYAITIGYHLDLLDQIRPVGGRIERLVDLHA